MKYLTILIFIILYSCSSKPTINDEVKEIESQIQEKEVLNNPIKNNNAAYIDSVITEMEDIYLYDYPNLTRWGGITTFYYQDTLIKVETQYNAEYVYTAYNYYINNDTIIEIHEKRGSFSDSEKIDFQVVINPTTDLLNSGYELLEFIDTNSQNFIVVYD